MTRPYAILAAALMLGGGATLARADQCAWVTATAAQRAVTLLRSAKVLQEICRPCGETKAKPLYIDHVEAVKVAGGQYVEVRVNGRGLDLAYVYVKDQADKNWINVGLQAQCGADVSQTKLRLEASDLAR